MCSYTDRQTDRYFAVDVSLITGKIVFISYQAATILQCNREQFTNVKFVEFLNPQDVNVFYSFTTPYNLPSWSMCTGTESAPTECRLEKSFFCRISGGRGRGGSLQDFPFRITPYLLKVQDAELAEEQSCCLLLAERVQSGYDDPRIPSDNRIFTTTHTPSCVFQDIDESLQPVHNMGSSGYSSHGSNSSHGNGKTIENRNVVDEPGKSKPRTFQEICKRVHILKSQDQPVYFPSPSKPESRETTDTGAQQHKSPVAFLKDLVVPPLLVKDSTAIAAASVEELTCNDQTVYSYQQISCLDSVIRYLESCITPVTVKRKCQFSSYTAFSMHASRWELHMQRSSVHLLCISQRHGGLKFGLIRSDNR
ncbi:period circadian protein homolog 2-like [Salvelinus fontinalis]|uniref:period circadian protein homolog 2-like n=1 Tax=Salvelinus fontinalis TaxID=8038 RepID=UPI00248694D0|nr:period circadian protein homolog 2-like [Salvelinus fontinalis]